MMLKQLNGKIGARHLDVEMISKLNDDLPKSY